MVMLHQVTGKYYSVSHLPRGRSTGSSKLKTGQVNVGFLGGKNGASYSRVPETSPGNEWVVVRGSECFTTGHSRENQLVTFCQDIVN